MYVLTKAERPPPALTLPPKTRGWLHACGGAHARTWREAGSRAASWLSGGSTRTHLRQLDRLRPDAGKEAVSGRGADYGAAADQRQRDAQPCEQRTLTASSTDFARAVEAEAVHAVGEGVAGRDEPAGGLRCAAGAAKHGDRQAGVTGGVGVGAGDEAEVQSPERRCLSANFDPAVACAVENGGQRDRHVFVNVAEARDTTGCWSARSGAKLTQ